MGFPRMFLNIFLSNYIYIIKQDIRIYVPYGRPNGWTEWPEICCGHSWIAWGFYRLKEIVFLFLFLFFFHRKRRALQLIL